MDRISSQNTPAHIETGRIFKEIYEFKTQESKGHFIIYDSSSGSNRKAGFFERIFTAKTQLKADNEKAREHLTDKLSNHLLKDLENNVFSSPDSCSPVVDWLENQTTAENAAQGSAKKILNSTLQESDKSKTNSKSTSGNFFQKSLNSIKNHWIAKRISHLFSDDASNTEKRNDIKRLFLKNIKEPANYQMMSNLHRKLESERIAQPDVNLPKLDVNTGLTKTIKNMEDALRYGELYEPRKQLIEDLRTDKRTSGLNESDRETIALYVAFLEKSEKTLGRDFLIEKAIDMHSISALIGKELANSLTIREKFDIVINATRATDEKYDKDWEDIAKVTEEMETNKKSFYEKKLKAESLICSRHDLHNEIKKDFKHLSEQKTGFSVEFEQVIDLMLDPECDELSNLGRLQAAETYRSNRLYDENKTLKSIANDLIQEDAAKYGKQAQNSTS